MKRALLIVNLGTPDKPAKKEVGRYLRAFLNDPYVIDLPAIWRYLLVNFIIIPFRTPKSTRLYQKLWKEGDSPLRSYLFGLQKKLVPLLEDEYEVFAAMRYGKPSLRKVLKEISAKNFEELVVLPLFPQYATSTAESVRQYIQRNFSGMKELSKYTFIEQFYDHPAYLDAMAKQIRNFDLESYDKILFSFHSLPNNQVEQFHPSYKAEGCICERLMPEYGSKCYKATCYQTTRKLARKLKIRKTDYHVGFQSRFAKNWVAPFTDQHIVSLAEAGAKSILVIAPSFVADCLETTVEIGMDYKDLFLEKGGHKLDMVPSLNDEDNWAEAVVQIVRG